MEFSNSVYFSQYEGVCFMNDYQETSEKSKKEHRLMAHYILAKGQINE